MFIYFYFLHKVVPVTNLLFQPMTEFGKWWSWSVVTTMFMVFNVTYYSKLHIVVTFHCHSQCKDGNVL